MSNFKDFTRAIAGIASALKGINTVVEDIPVPGGAGGIDYSETEQDTGIKWTDGTPVYQKTFIIDSLPASNTQIPHGIDNFGILINAEGSVEQADTFNLYLPSRICEIYVSPTNLAIVYQGSVITGRPAQVTLYYTKTSE